MLDARSPDFDPGQKEGIQHKQQHLLVHKFDFRAVRAGATAITASTSRYPITASTRWR
jgi:hypothetical protein